jgi:hypothetical protein
LQFAGRRLDFSMPDESTETPEEPAVAVDPQRQLARQIIRWLANSSFVLAIVLDLWWFDTWLWRGVMFVPMLAFTFFVLFFIGYIPVRVFVRLRREKQRR